jgi:SAM-dependent methyltransferase
MTEPWRTFPVPAHPSSARIVGLYEENAAAWDRMRGRDLHEAPWLDPFLAAVPEGGAILDVGCGMGEPVARYFIERGYRLTGVDSSPSLIAMCRGRFPEQAWLVADMRALDLGRRFDGVIAWHSLLHLSPDDQRLALARLAAHVSQGAPLMFTSGPQAGEEIGEWMGEPLYHGSLGAKEYRALLAGAGFGEIAHRVRDPDCGSSTVWLARCEGPAESP